MTRPTRRLLLLLAAAAACLQTSAALAREIVLREGSCAAIAYAPSTDRYYYAYDYNSRAAAERAALNRAKESDARIVVWVRRGFCALAVGKDKQWGVGWSYGNGSSNIKAINHALRECRERTSGGRIRIVLSSDGQYVETR